jgi:hypothetical protein
MSERESPLASWDFRMNEDELKPDDIIDNLKGIAKHYVFQLEEGDGGYRHYQGRISLIKKRRKAEKHILLKLFKYPPNYLEPTVGEEFRKGEAFYQLKEDTRIDGPWKDTDEVKILTRQLEMFKVMDYRPYQADLLKMATIFDMRKIDLIYDPYRS